MRILVVGGGGREHVLCWKLSQSPQVGTVYCIPGNSGIESLDKCTCINSDGEDIDFLLDFAIKEAIDFTVVGPEAPLVKGIVDSFRSKGLLILGPEKEASLLEGSKVWAKEFMREFKIPTASFEVFDNYEKACDYIERRNCPLVIKADGLAAGKGVFVTDGPGEAKEAVNQIMKEKVFGAAGSQIIIEERLSGEEASILALTDGERFWTMPSAQDHKAAYEGDTGPNTGGMGAYSPAPVMDADKIRFTEENVFVPLLKGMKKRGLVYRGIIYAGLMITEEGPQVLEFNVRFGDPEAQVIIPRFDGDITTVLKSAAGGNLTGEWRWSDFAAVCVVMASGGYPGSYEKGKEIKGLPEAGNLHDTFVFHAGTAKKNGKIVTAGGRVLGVTAWAENIKEAVEAAYIATEKVSFEDAYYRKDIAHRAINR